MVPPPGLGSGSAVVPVLPAALCCAGNQVGPAAELEETFTMVSSNCVWMFQVQQQQSPALASLPLLLPALLYFPHPASLGTSVSDDEAVQLLREQNKPAGLQLMLFLSSPDPHSGSERLPLVQKLSGPSAFLQTAEL